MPKTPPRASRLLLPVAISSLIVLGSARAEVGVTETDYPSTFGNPIALFWLGVVVIAFVMAVGGLAITWKRPTATSEVSATLHGKSSFKVSKVGQGVLIVMIGGAVMWAAFERIPKESRVRHVDKVTTTEEFDPTTGKHKKVLGDLPPTDKPN